MRVIYTVTLLLYFSCSYTLAGTMTSCIDHYPPYQFLEPEPSGESVIALKILANLLNHQIEFIKGPNFARCIRMLELGQVDVLAGLVSTDERRKFAYMIPYHDDTHYVFINHKNAPIISSLSQLSGKVVGVTKNTIYFAELEQDKSITKIQIKDIKSGLNLVVKSRIDVVITSEKVIQSIMLENPYIKNDIKINPYSHSTGRKLYFGISKNSQLDVSSKLLEKVEQGYRNHIFSKAIENFVRTHPHLYSKQ